MNFGNWNEAIHNDTDQQKRLKTAQKPQCTPLSIDQANQSGSFSGRSGFYNVTLDQCDCIDFIRRGLPCKHIYRLAIELKQIDVQAKSDSTRIISPPNPNDPRLPEVVDKVEQLTVNEQRQLKRILLKIIYYKKFSVGVHKHKSITKLLKEGFIHEYEDKEELLSVFPRNKLNEKIVPLNINGFKKNMSHQKLIKWCLDNIPEEINNICSEALTVRLNPIYNDTKKKLYTYFHRKFDRDLYFDGENLVETPVGVKESISMTITPNKVDVDINDNLPDDEITALLVKYHR